MSIKANIEHILKLQLLNEQLELQQQENVETIGKLAIELSDKLNTIEEKPDFFNSCWQVKVNLDGTEKLVSVDKKGCIWQIVDLINGN